MTQALEKKGFTRHKKSKGLEVTVGNKKDLKPAS